MAFACAGVAAGAFAALARPASARRALREPLLLVLLALALVGALSALWTLGPEARTLRWAAVTLGYAGVMLAAAVAAGERRARIVLAAGLAAIAAVAGAIGLGAWALQEHPYALEIAGGWRPAGPFEYPPALALLMASALPIFIVAARLRARSAAALGVAGVAIAAAVLALAESRIGLALGVAIAAVALHREPLSRRPQPPRWSAVAWLFAVAAGALLAGAVAFGSDGSFLHGRERTWEAAVETFLDRPVGGAGADAFLAGSARHQEGDAILFAHNLPLELAAELGLAGLALALALYWTTARLVWRRRRAWLFAPAAVAFPLANLLDWSWHLAGAGAVWALAAGALAGGASNLRRPPKPEGDT